nr:ADM_HP1_G0026040.mRNA.1.CDS.1 [Saccharomyces cerevisiae]
MSFTNKLGFARYPGLFCNLCGHSMVRTCNMVEAAQNKPHHLWQHLRETPSSCQTLHRNRVAPRV